MLPTRCRHTKQMHLLELTGTLLSLLSNLIWWKVSLPLAGNWSEMSSGVPSNANHPVLLCFHTSLPPAMTDYIHTISTAPSSLKHHTKSPLPGFPGAHLGAPSNAAVVAPEGDTLLLQGHILQVLGGLADVHALDGLRGLSGVLPTQKRSSEQILPRDSMSTTTSVLPILFFWLQRVHLPKKTQVEECKTINHFFLCYLLF